MATPQFSPDEVPQYHRLMIFLLRIAEDGQVHRVVDIVDHVASQLGLTDQAKASTLPDGRNKLRHRLEWARTYLKKAGLIDYPARGSFRVTSRGLQILGQNPHEITREMLLQFPEFREFVNPDEDAAAVAPIATLPLPEFDPEEGFENAYQALRRSLEAELLERIKKAPPAFMEQLVIDLLLAMGYGGSKKDAGKALGRTGDGGIDGIINEDPLGLDVVYVQAKRWVDTVGR